MLITERDARDERIAYSTAPHVAALLDELQADKAAALLLVGTSWTDGLDRWDVVAVAGTFPGFVQVSRFRGHDNRLWHVADFLNSDELRRLPCAVAQGA